MDEELLADTLDSIEVLYRQGDKEEALDALERIRKLAEAFIEDLT